MSKLQRFIIIVAAFGIVSLVLTQTKSNALLGSNSPEVSHPQSITIAQGAGPVAILNANTQNSNKSVALVNLHGAPQNSELPTATATNLYQTQSGSFYFIANSPQQTALDSPIVNSQSLRSDTRHEQTYQVSPLLSTSADISITGPIARTRLTQVFKNTTDFVRSGIYVFPLPHDAAVDHLLMTVGDRKIEGEIKRKAIAQAMFTKAKAEGKKASLVAQIRPNMFSNKIANIPPHSEISVTIEYQQFIVQDKHNYALRLPLSITPRYTPNSHIENQISSAEPASSIALNHLPSNTKIKISLNTGMPLSNISSEHHPIKIVNPYNNEYQIELDHDAADKLANKDFVLNWQMKLGYSIQASHFTYQANDYEYGLITLLPPSADQLNAKRNLVFVLDVSGSMVGESIEQAKQSLAIAIQDLQPEDYFNLVAFSSDATRMWSQSQLASENAKNEALTFIYGLEANGGTEIKAALDMAFSIPAITEQESDYLNQVLFITDGSISNEDELMRTIYEKLGDYRLFTVGIGSAPNAHFMTEAANAGKGTYTFIGDTSTVKPKMARLLDKLKKPALSNLHLNIKDTKQAFGFEVYPKHLPDLYADEPLIITYRRQVQGDANSSIVPFSLLGEYLSATANGNLHTRKWSTQLPVHNTKSNNGIHKYWARLKIKDLSQQLNKNVPNGEDDVLAQSNLKELITQVALKHYLVSQYTSLVAIDHDYTKFAANDTKKRPLYAQAQLPRTATPSGLFAFIGSILISLSLLILHMQRKHKG